MSAAAAIAWILAPVVLGVLAAVYSFRGGWTAWYDLLRKPAWTPPAGAFGPVWTALYLAMGAASYMAWRRGGDMTAYCLQLALNLWWTVLFFRARDPGLAGIEIVGLLLAIAATIRSFEAVSGTAAVLMLPYAAWTAFAAALTWTIATLNPPSS